MPLAVIYALARVKKAAAAASTANSSLLDEKKAEAIERAADEVLAGKHDEEFPLVGLADRLRHADQHERQRGARQPRLRAARRRARAEAPGAPERRRQPGPVVERRVPDRDAHRRGAARCERRCLPALDELRDDAAAQEPTRSRASSRSAARTCRTRRRSRWARSSPATWRSSSTRATAIGAAQPACTSWRIGGTAVGTGLNTHPRVRARGSARRSRRTGLPFAPAPNKFAALAGHEALVFAHGALKTLAAALMKIANDIRLLASGPRSGLRRAAHSRRTSPAARSCRARSTRRRPRR